MTKPSKKPANFMIKSGAGPDITPQGGHRMSIKAIRDFMENWSMATDETAILINTETRNSWSVDPGGRWI